MFVDIRLVGVVRCLEWCRKMRDKAGQAGDFKEWSNYDKMAQDWERRIHEEDL
ncbi:hypothetical protein CPT_Premi_048 [Proteus phage Premi]|uniref:Uncharacterized protein n=1 Tax=Proteus phage Premi TaxID=3097470 RepID=A0ABZ0ZXM3_9CAUD|nr:hypothetical protein CPT_Premi_048 [Proteus phage Premi]